MTFKTYEINVDLVNDISTTSAIRFSQNDRNSAKLLLTITNKGEEIDLSKAKSVRMSFKKPDGTRVFQNDCQPINAMKGKYQIVLKTQTLTSVGNVIAQIHIEEEDRILDTQKFLFVVNDSLASDEAIESTNEFTIIQKAIEAGTKLEKVDIDGIIAAGAKADAALPKAGGTMTGHIDFDVSAANKWVGWKRSDGKRHYVFGGADVVGLFSEVNSKTPWRYVPSTDTFDVNAVNTNLVKKSGDTMTGDLGVQIPTSGANGISFKSTTGSDIHKWIGTNSGAVAWQDKLANLDVMNYSSASKSLTLMNGIVFNVNGETNLVKKTGDTMTGTLEIRKPSPVVELTIPNGSKKVKLLYNAGDTADYGFQISTPTGKAFLRTEGESTIREIATKEKDGRAELTLTADATNNSESYKPLAVRRGNTVTVRMEITRKEGSTNNLVCTLPEGMRPIETLTQTFIAQDGTPVTVNVSYTGNVEVYTTGKRVKIVYTYVAD